MIGFICINKKSGDSSSYCVAKVKRKTGSKCGHMGTLDPLASGVLPIAIGQATRMFDYLLDKVKVYRAVFTFQYSTPSFDLETQPDFYSEKIPTQQEIEDVLPSLTGSILQVPPVYSAKFVDGQRSYKLARKGIKVELKPKRVEIFYIKIIKKISESSYEFEIACGGGTYIRSIIKDMADLLGCHGTMLQLVRIKSGQFDIEKSITVDQLNEIENIADYIIKPEDLIDYEVLSLSKETAKRLIDGLPVKLDNPSGLYKVFNEDVFWGIGLVENKTLKMKTYLRDV